MACLDVVTRVFMAFKYVEMWMGAGARALEAVAMWREMMRVPARAKQGGKDVINLNL